ASPDAAPLTGHPPILASPGLDPGTDSNLRRSALPASSPLATTGSGAGNHRGQRGSSEWRRRRGVATARQRGALPARPCRPLPSVQPTAIAVLVVRDHQPARVG